MKKGDSRDWANVLAGLDLESGGQERAWKGDWP